MALTQNAYKDPLARIPMIGGGGGGGVASGMAPVTARPPVLNTASLAGGGSYAPSIAGGPGAGVTMPSAAMTVAPSTAAGPSTGSAPAPGFGGSGAEDVIAEATGRRNRNRRRDVRNTEPGDIQGMSPEDYYQGPTWQELIGQGKNPGGKGYLRKIRKRAPGFLQDQQAFDDMMQNIREIIGSEGEVSPAVLQRGQADAEAGRAAGSQSIAGRAAQMGITPDDPRYAVMEAINNQTSNRLGSERLRDYEILGEQRKRTDLATMNPIMSFLLQMLHPKSAGNIAPGASAASTSPDYGAAAGGVGNALAAFLNNRGA